MHEAEKPSPEQIEAFLRASEEIQFHAERREEIYPLGRATPAAAGIREAKPRPRIGTPLRGEDDGSEPGAGDAADRAVPRAGWCKRRLSAVPVCARYTRADIELLAAVDEAHETLSGPATQKILYREFTIRQAGVPAAGDDLGGTSVQSAQTSAIASAV